VSVDRLAFSAVADGVATGVTGGGALAATGRRPAQPLTIIASKNAQIAIPNRFVLPLPEYFTFSPGSRGGALFLRCSFRRTTRFQPACRLGQLLRNLSQELCRPLFRFRRKIIFHESLQPSQLVIQLASHLFKLVHGVFLGPAPRLRSLQRNSGIIGTHSAARKEADYPFPIIGSSASIAGKTPLADFSEAAATINHVPDFVPHVALSSASMPRAAMNVAQTCVSRSPPSAKGSRVCSASLMLP